jgi:hypothetical protein
MKTNEDKTQSDYILKEKEIAKAPYPATRTRVWLCTKRNVPWRKARQKAYVQGPQKTDL